MRVILLHNPSAGGNDHSAGELADEVRAAGHNIVHDVGTAGELAAALGGGGADLVVVAGGDGTVGEAAGVMKGSEVPMTLVPVGTANNIAGTLGLPRTTSAAALARGWSSGRVIRFDAAWAVRGVGERLGFFEAYGLGFFARFMGQESHADDDGDADDVIARQRRRVREALAAAPSDPYVVSLDDRHHDGEYVLVEVMNIPFLGPQLELAPRADPRDGELDVVLLDGRARDRLVAALEADRPLDVPVLRARSISISVEDEIAVHRDGERLPMRSRERTWMGIDLGAVRLLIPGD